MRNGEVGVAGGRSWAVGPSQLALSPVGAGPGGAQSTCSGWDSVLPPSRPGTCTPSYQEVNEAPHRTGLDLGPTCHFWAVALRALLTGRREGL